MGCCESSPEKPVTERPPQKAPEPKAVLPTQSPVEEPQGKVEHMDNAEWPWSRPTASGKKGKKRATDFYYTKEFLQSFRILNAVEARAYQAYLAEDFDGAREILQTGGDDISSPLLSPADDTPSDGKLFEGETGERMRGGSVAAVTAGPGKDWQGNEKKVAFAVEEPKSPRTTELILSAVKRCPLFLHLSSSFHEHEVVVKAMKKMAFESHASVFTQGEYPSEEQRGWHVVISGKCLVKRRKVKECRMPGDFFGEAVVMNATSRSNMDVSASDKPLTTYSLTHESYTSVLSTIAHQRREKYKEELRKVRVGERQPFGEMPEADLAQLADCLCEKSYKPGETIIKYGTPGLFAHIIMKGSVHVVGRKDGEPFKVCEFSAGEDPIGFLEFFNPEGTSLTIADVIASPEDSDVVTACISREHFEKCIGTVKDILQDMAATSNVYEYYRGVTQQQ
ncbi:Protein kinase A regulatory subunit [Diplonema papillatum]|nr:Protein kinase A regulatory subunit [Diplonema papillatum]